MLEEPSKYDLGLDRKQWMLIAELFIEQCEYTIEPISLLLPASLFYMNLVVILIST